METVKAHCNRCLGERNHKVLYIEQTAWDQIVDNEFSVDGWDNYEMIKCLGCDGVSLRHQSYFSEDCDEHGNRCATTKYYPPTISRKEPLWMYSLCCINDSIHDILKEVYICLHNDCPRLATMGIRSLIELIMVEKVGDNGTFGKNIDKFEASGFISRIQRTVLEPVLEAGHATMHRDYAPTSSALSSIIDITENIIESIYINEKRAESFRGKVPPRAPKTQ
jgi:hypothetical protein